jgi:hypothetical protein
LRIAEEIALAAWAGAIDRCNDRGRTNRLTIAIIAMADAAMRLAREAIDDAAAQAQLLLGLDPRAARLLAREIIAEGDFNTKLGKFIHLVIDRLRLQAGGAPSVAGIAREIAAIDNGAPTDPGRFRAWIVRQYAAMAEANRGHERQLCEWRRRLEDLRTRVSEETVPRADYDAAVKARKSSEANFSKQAHVYDAQIADLNARVEQQPHEGVGQHEADSVLIRKLRAENDRLQEALSAAQAKQALDRREKPRRQANDDFQRKRGKWKQLKRTLREKAAEHDALLLGLKAENGQLRETADRLQRTLESQLAASQQEKEELLRQIGQLRRVKGGLDAKVETAELRLAERNCEARQWQAQLDAMAKDQRAIVAKLGETERQVRSLEAQRVGPIASRPPPCRGCGIDVRRLRQRFDSLESGIDQLQTTLMRPVRSGWRS